MLCSKLLIEQIMHTLLCFFQPIDLPKVAARAYKHIMSSVRNSRMGMHHAYRHLAQWQALTEIAVHPSTSQYCMLLSMSLVHSGLPSKDVQKCTDSIGPYCFSMAVNNSRKAACVSSLNCFILHASPVAPVVPDTTACRWPCVLPSYPYPILSSSLVSLGLFLSHKASCAPQLQVAQS